MRSKYHFVATIAASSAIYLIFKSLPCFIISFISGFLIDLDHLLDYYVQEGITLKFEKFYEWCFGRKFKYSTLILHSLEFLFLLWFLIYVFWLGQFWLSLAIGFSQHMIFDLIFNQNILKTHKFYFLTIRIYERFHLKEFLRK